MSQSPQKPDGSSAPAKSDEERCPLSQSQQFRNLVLFAACTGLQYLAAPLIYVGITQASLCKRLGATAQVANLPGTFFFAMTAAPALVAWMFPRIEHLRPLLIFCYATCASVMALVAVALGSEMISNDQKIGLVILQGAVCGATIPTAIALLWEVIGRGAEESRRGVALGLAFGAGPVLAVVGSFLQAVLLGNRVLFWEFSGLDYPYSFICLYALGAPAMFLAAGLSWLFLLPSANSEPERQPFSHVAGLIVGLVLGFAALMLFSFGPRDPNAQVPLVDIVGYALAIVAVLLGAHHFRDVLSHRLLLLATLVTILLYTGNTIPSNMNLYTEVALGEAPDKYAGMQNILRFGFKVTAGAMLGWLLTRTNPKTGLLLTGAVFMLAQVWALFSTGTLFLIAFGIYGAGELVGVYAPNYMLSAAPKSLMRRNMALATMLMVPAAPFGYLFGTIADSYRDAADPAMGYRVSFAVCAAIMLAGLMLAQFALPAQPRLVGRIKERSDADPAGVPQD